MTVLENVVLKTTNADQTRPLVDSICELYDVVFSQLPFDWTSERSGVHRKDLEQLLARSRFGAVTAHVGSELVGFGYGTPLQPDTHWWQDAVAPLPYDLTAEWPGRTFAVIDFGVRPGYRRQGIGRALLDLLLAGRDEERATLAVRPTATGAHAFYQHTGWRKVGRVAGAPGQPAPFFDLYVIPLGTKP